MWDKTIFIGVVVVTMVTLIIAYAKYRKSVESSTSNEKNHKELTEGQKEIIEGQTDSNSKLDQILSNIESFGLSNPDAIIFLKDLLGENFKEILENEESRNNLATKINRQSLSEILKERDDFRKKLESLDLFELGEETMAKFDLLFHELKYQEVIKEVDHIIENKTLDPQTKSKLYFIKGFAFDYLFRYDDAIDQIEKAILLYESNERFYSYLGNIYLSKKQYRKAEKTFLDGLAVCNEKKIMKSYSAGLLFRDHARSLFYLGKYEDAIKYLEKSLNIWQDHVPNKSEEAFTINRLAETYINQNHYKKALELNTNADSIAKKYTKDKSLFLPIQMNYARVYTHLEKFNKASESIDKAMKYFIEVNGDENPAIAGLYLERGHFHHEQGEYDEALSDYEKARDIDIAHYGENHAGLAAVYSGIASIYDKKEDYKMAKETYEKSLNIGINTLPKYHPSLALYYNNLGYFLFRNKKYQLAKGYLEQAINIFSNIPNPNKYTYSQALYELATILLLGGEYDKPLKMFLESERIWVESGKFMITQSFGQLKYNIGICYGSKLKFNMASKYMNEALSILKKCYPEGHVSIEETKARIEEIKKYIK